MLPIKRTRYLWSPVAIGLFVTVMGLMLSTGMMYGQAATDPSTVTRDEVNQVARELWCPLCSGVRLDSCELKACDQMRDVISIKLSEGEDTESIKDYFVNQYGPQVLGEPPREGFNWLAWILPFVTLIVGGVFVWNRARNMMDTQHSETGGDGGENDLHDVATVSSDTVAEPSQTGEDVYDRKLEEELAKYG